MKKILVNFEGKGKMHTWDVKESSTSQEPHFVIQRHSIILKVSFESKRELERFYQGVEMCRCKYKDNGFIKDIYLTGVW